MEIRNLVTFIHVAEQGSFTRAAELLGYSQSTVSFQIKQLEDELGCLLFERINHTITLTERAHDLIRYAHSIRSLIDEFKEGFNDEHEYRGHIHVVTPDSICEDMINNNYADFHAKYPLISLKFTTADTSVMVDMLNRNEADIIVTLDSHIYSRDHVIAMEKQLGMHLVTSPSSRFAGARGLSLVDIAKEPFVLTESGQGYRKALEKEFAKHSLEIDPVLEIGRTDIITSVLTKSNMISFLPDFVTADKVRSGELCYLDVRDMKVEIYKQLIYHKNKWLSRSMRAFIDYVRISEFSS